MKQVSFPADMIGTRSMTASMFKVYGAIALAASDGYSPTLSEISQRTGVDINRVCVTAGKLERGGWLIRHKEGKRNIYTLSRA